MFFRVRTSLTERPGSLAALASRCGDAGLNILGFQIFPDLGHVTDELVVSVPEGWTARAVAELVGGAGGAEVSVEPCTSHDLVDQPTRWLAAAHDLVEDPSLLPDLLERLLGPHPERWSATEHSRAAALRALAESVTGSPIQRSPAAVSYAETPDGVIAQLSGHVVGAARFASAPQRELTIEVAPSWRRLGLGTNLLMRAVAQAARTGSTEVVVLAPAEDEGFVTMVCNAGLRARIQVKDGMLVARIVVAGASPVRRAEPEPREGSPRPRG